MAKKKWKPEGPMIAVNDVLKRVLPLKSYNSWHGTEEAKAAGRLQVTYVAWEPKAAYIQLRQPWALFGENAQLVIFARSDGSYDWLVEPWRDFKTGQKRHLSAGGRQVAEAIGRFVAKHLPQPPPPPEPPIPVHELAIELFEEG